ncbi:efflux RND transporter permease subunit [Gracilinema caldarium]|uniref:efflux RND transporter permease subunit n=1 Tax=Gracilinema caldarium TaxID=215591 RepID=UPI0026E9E5BB|nr:efflux RND transporter permease subunit [Gracilinema caldarium]
MLLDKPLRTLALLCFAVLLALSLLLMDEGTAGRDSADASYAITIRHYGINGEEMERTVAIPLEDALSAIPGLKRLVSTSEQGKVRVLAQFSGSNKGIYEAVRDAAQAVYEGLPPSAQRPEIASSRDSRIPLWSAAVLYKEGFSPSVTTGKDLSLGTMLERRVKPALERLENAGEVELAGTGLPELCIKLDEAACAARGIEPWMLARELAEGDLLVPAGTFRSGDREIMMSLDGKSRSVQDLLNRLVNLPSGGVVPLSQLGTIQERDRYPEILARLDGKTAAVISVMGSSQAQQGSIAMGKLSRDIKRTIQELSDLPLEFRVLSDRGEEEERALRSVFSAALQGTGAVALAVLLFIGADPLMGLLSVPLIMLFSAALLRLFGFPLDRLSLAGLSCGVGAAVDGTILVFERVGGAGNTVSKQKALASLAPSLFASTLTTIAALLPLALLGSDSAMISAVAWGIGVSSALSLLVSLVFLPPLIGFSLPIPWIQALKGRARRILRRILRRFLQHQATAPRRLTVLQRSIAPHRSSLQRLSAAPRRSASRLMLLSYRKPRLTVLVFAALSIVGFTAMIAAGADTAPLPSEDSVYAQIECEGGLLAEKVNEELADYVSSLRSKDGIKAVQTSARTGSASLLVSFDPRKQTVEQVRDLVRSIPVYGGFVYIPEASSRDRIWKITVAGDDAEICKDIARRLASRCQGDREVREAVLNFKEGSLRSRLIPDREKMAALGLSTASLADTLKRSVYGPVIYKRVAEGGEMDVRLQYGTEDRINRSSLLAIPLKAPLRVFQVLTETGDREPSSIRRENRRRVASLSVRTRPMDPRRIRDRLRPLFAKETLPPGYSVEFDREATEAAESLSRITVYFMLALLFCFMVIAVATESFAAPLPVLAVVPPSLAIPALATVLSGSAIDLALACAFVAVSGIAVNAAVLAVEALREGGPVRREGYLYRALRRRFSALAATSLTTVIGSVPFLFLPGAANQVVRSLALVSTLGVSASALSSISLIPALASLWPDFTIPSIPQQAGSSSLPEGAQS